MADMIERFLPLDDFEISRVDRTGRTVTAYAAVFGQQAPINDQYGRYFEEINRTAFNRTLSHGIGKVQVFYNHGYDLSGRPNILGAVPIATPLEVKPDGKGLITISRYNDGELADAVLAAWEGGQITGQSFRGPVYKTRKVGTNGDLPIIERMELGLREYGPTPSPAYEGAGLVAIRSQQELADLVRSMITELVGTHAAPPASLATSDDSELGNTGDSLSDTDQHSYRIHARKNALIARRILLGVHRDATAHVGSHSG